MAKNRLKRRKKLRKVRKKLNPLIEDEKLMLKSLVSDMAQKGYVALSKKIGADKVHTKLTLLLLIDNNPE